MKVQERKISIDEVFDAHKRGTLEGAFGTGTAATIAPITSIGFEGKDYVFVSTGVNQYEIIEISKGISENNFIEITLNKYEFLNYPFVKKGAYSLLMQLKNNSNE